MLARPLSRRPPCQAGAYLDARRGIGGRARQPRQAMKAKRLHAPAFTCAIGDASGEMPPVVGTPTRRFGGRQRLNWCAPVNAWAFFMPRAGASYLLMCEQATRGITTLVYGGYSSIAAHRPWAIISLISHFPESLPAVRLVQQVTAAARILHAA